jgi:hypothetical protein
MLNKISSLLRISTNPKIMKMLLSMSSHGYLKEVGWVNSVNRGIPLDIQNNPVAWVTYPFMDFIRSRLDRSMKIFEYGSGNSTLYYANLVDSVTAVEHDKKWYDQLTLDIPENVDLHFQSPESTESYAHFPNTLKNKFQIIIIDGRSRVKCMMRSTTALTKDGIIVLDDSERVQYQKGIEFLVTLGFKKIDFWGIAPGISYKKSTTIFYKSKNCIGL